VNDALEQEPGEHWRAYFPLSLLLGTRRTELLSARWEDMDLERRTWRIPATKSGRPHLLPLPAAREDSPGASAAHLRISLEGEIPRCPSPSRLDIATS